MTKSNVELLSIGFGNAVVASRVVAILNPFSAPAKRAKGKARENSKLIDATEGRKTRSIIITDSDHFILSGIQAETIGQRLMGKEELNIEKEIIDIETDKI